MGLNHIHRIIILVFSIHLIEPSTPSGMPDAPITEIVPPDELEVRNELDVLRNGSTLAVKLGETITLLCAVKNGVFAPKLTWLRDGVKITKDSRAGLVSNAIWIKRTVTSYDNGAMYSCVCEHPALNRTLRTIIFLRFIPPPGPPEIEGYIEGDIVKEGDNLTLACISRRGNYPARLDWLRNDVLVDTTYSTVRGETTNNYTFTVGPEDNNAVYKCEASNRLTVHPSSKSVRLNVMYPPVAPTVTGYDGSKPLKVGDLQKFVCTSIDGNPPVTLKWYKNDKEIRGREINTTSMVSTNELIIRVEENDNGATYRCDAINGASDKPLSASVRPSVLLGPPEPPYNICIVNSSSDSVVLSWTPGYSSGLPQLFRIKYAETGCDDESFAYVFPPNATVFIVNGLKPGTEYTFSMSAKNMKGESVYSTENTRAVTQKWQGSPSSPTSIDYTPRILLIFLPVIGSLLLILNIIWAICFIKTRKGRDNNGELSKSRKKNDCPDILENGGMDHESILSVPLTDPFSSTEIVTEDSRFPKTVLLPSDDSPSLYHTSESPPPGNHVLGTVGNHLV